MHSISFIVQFEAQFFVDFLLSLLHLVVIQVFVFFVVEEKQTANSTGEPEGDGAQDGEEKPMRGQQVPQVVGIIVVQKRTWAVLRPGDVWLCCLF